jgi:hypothetical protein
LWAEELITEGKHLTKNNKVFISRCKNTRKVSRLNFLLIQTVGSKYNKNVCHFCPILTEFEIKVYILVKAADINFRLNISSGSNDCSMGIHKKPT